MNKFEHAFRDLDEVYYAVMDKAEIKELKLTREDYTWMLSLEEKARRIADKIKELDEADPTAPLL